MNFKKWLNETKSSPEKWKQKISTTDMPLRLGGSYLIQDKIKEIIQEITTIAKENNLPEPVRKLDEGSQAIIFDTTDPNIILRISHHDQRNACEKIINLPQFQKTGGVNVIKKLIIQNNLMLSWKEKIQVNWSRELLLKYKTEFRNPKYNAIQTLAKEKLNDELLNKIIPILKKIPETKNLVKAINLGIPTEDISEYNIGLSTTDSKFPNSLQIIDC